MRGRIRPFFLSIPLSVALCACAGTILPPVQVQIVCSVPVVPPELRDGCFNHAPVLPYGWRTGTVSISGVASFITAQAGLLGRAKNCLDNARVLWQSIYDECNSKATKPKD